MTVYRIEWELFDTFDTTTSDGFSGGSVGWGKRVEKFEARNDAEAENRGLEIIRNAGKYDVREVIIWKFLTDLGFEDPEQENIGK